MTVYTVLFTPSKESLDSHILSLFLLNELGESSQCEWCRLIRYDYTGAGGCNYVVATPTGLQSLKRSFDGFDLNSTQRIEFRIQSRGYETCNELYPIVAFFEGYVLSDGGVAFCTSYEPYMLNQDVLFPVHPEGTTFRWTKGELSFTEHDTAFHADESLQDELPNFNNPVEIYGLFDSLRLYPHLLGHTKTTSTLAVLPGDDMNLSSELVRYDGRCMRTASIAFNTGYVQSISIDQPSLMLLHRNSECYTISKNADNMVYEEIEFQPSSLVEYLPKGRHIDIMFRHSEDPQKALQVVPSSIDITRQGHRVYRARYMRLTRRGGSHDNQEYTPESLDERLEARHRQNAVYQAIAEKKEHFEADYYRDDQLSPPACHDLIRARLKYNAYAAILIGDFPTLEAVLNRHRALLASEGIEDDMYIYNIEALAEMAFYFVKEDFGWIVVDAFLRPAYRKCDQKTLAQHIIRLCNQYRMGYALLAIEALAETTESDPRIKNWLATMEAQIRKIAKGDLAGHRRPLYAYADRYEQFSRYVEKQQKGIYSCERTINEE